MNIDITDVILNELKLFEQNFKGKLKDRSLPITHIINFLIDNPEEEKLTKKFLDILNSFKDYKFAIQVFKNDSDIQILQNLKSIDRVDTSLEPNEAVKEDVNIFICQSFSIITRKLSNFLFYAGDRPKKFFMERFDSQSLRQIVTLLFKA
jgi:hypothetical protein